MKSISTFEPKQLKIGRDLITISGVKGDPLLFSIDINKVFQGYIQKRDNEYHRLDNSKINIILFARICQELKCS